VVALNAAAGFLVAGRARNLADGLEKANELLANGEALAKLKALRSF
jgi:anthranilate phosphoribosyltransferase